MKAVTACDKVALYLHLLVFVGEVYAWLVRRDIVQRDILDIKKNLPTLLETCCDSILHNLMLWIHGNGFPVRQFLKVDAMTIAIET